MAGSTVQLLLAELTEAELFSSSHPQEWENGILGRSIPSTGNRTEFSLTARCFSLRRENFMGPLTTVVEMVSALFTSCAPGRLANGASERVTAFKAQTTAAARSPI